MRLLFTIPDFWPHVRRGSERVVHDLSTSLVKRGHEVTVVTRTPGRRPVTTDDDGVRVVYRPARRPSWPLARWDPLELFALTAAGAGLHRAADVYHAFYLTDAYGLANALRMRRAPLVISLHGPPGRRWWEEQHPRTHRWFERALTRAAVVTVLSRDSADRLRRDYGRDCVVLAPGIFADDFSRPRRRGERRSIVCTAAIDDGRKRIDVLLDAFAEVASDEPDLELILAGPGSGVAVAERTSRMRAEVAARVLRRDVPTAALPELLSGCTVGALTSETEAFGLVLVEYLAAGMPVVGTRHAGIPEVIAPGTGVTFERGDAHDCARALREALALAEDPGGEQRCRAHARTFDWSTRIDAYLEMYAQALAS